MQRGRNFGKDYVWGLKKRSARKLAAFCFKFTRENKDGQGEGRMDIKGMGAMMQAMGILLPIIDQKHRQDLAAAWNITLEVGHGRKHPFPR
ncbi:hypothetical protein [Leptospirillum ferrooxidans]|uniref:hypothetical protein n=1 Tax=Leptospirillum ferrooxidans TaxID=180 RepID=UPI0011D2A4EB|nr:hypothetical protein [Leptospirillum ferrooxidans]